MCVLISIRCLRCWRKIHTAASLTTTLRIAPPHTGVRGHRASSCKHSERPLVVVKRQGRPQRTCDHCLETRNHHQVSVSCDCKAPPASNNSSQAPAALVDFGPASLDSWRVKLREEAEQVEQETWADVALRGGCPCRIGTAFDCICCEKRKQNRTTSCGKSSQGEKTKRQANEQQQQQQQESAASDLVAASATVENGWNSQSDPALRPEDILTLPEHIPA